MSICKCRRVFKSSCDKWVVLERNPDSRSLLKCLTCGWKWKSKAKYVEKLRDHTERSRSGLTDADILAKIIDGTLIVSPCGNRVCSWRKNVGSTNLKISKHRGDNGKGSTYRFVQICCNGLKKKISVHRLVWISVNLRMVPEGFDVDHIRGKGIPNPDGISNLRLLESLANQTRGYVSPSCEPPF